MCAEGFLRLFGTSPISGCDTWTCNPDLSHAIGRKRLERRRIHNSHILVSCRMSAADNPGLIIFARRRCDCILLHCCSRHTVKFYSGSKTIHARRHQRRLRQSIARMETLGVESTTSELLAEILERLPSDRLGTIEGNRPTAEVEFVDLLLADAAYA